MVNHVPKEKLLVDMIKRRCVRVMTDLTECPPDTIPAHLSRLDDCREAIQFGFRHAEYDPAETRPSGAQLGRPYTMADYLEALNITRKEHRAPAWVNDRDATLKAINRKLDLIGGHLAAYGENYQGGNE